MRKLTNEEIEKIIKNHEKWLKMAKEVGDDYDSNYNWVTSDLKADLSDVDLSGVDLSGLDLRSADFHGSILKGANLSESDFSSANFNKADLSKADLSYSSLRYADFNGSNLRDTVFSYSDLRDAEFMDTDLSNTNLIFSNLHGTLLGNSDLSYANLVGVDFSEADLRGANFNGAYISDVNLLSADLRGAKNVPYIPMICPEEDSFIGWKKCKKFNSGVEEEVLVKLQIPAGAKRSSATTRKCRCNKASVIGIYNLDGTKASVKRAYSDFDSDFIYEVGKTVEVTNFDEDRWAGCAPGIHFFMNREEAVRY